MPSKMTDLHGWSRSSYFSEEACLPSERQVGFWKAETMADRNGEYCCLLAL
ncbi:hypothetical protein CK203_044868 [Vitis vinifera]|uniref:Uncharacterized protein n=1 Tax=Vitis vinifera TaxID=29760 RepID=A0A438H0B6_VITVI|nr:hypothetical protein CK203_044868 [Vitis vinifera]